MSDEVKPYIIDNYSKIVEEDNNKISPDTLYVMYLNKYKTSDTTGRMTAVNYLKSIYKYGKCKVANKLMFGQKLCRMSIHKREKFLKKLKNQ